MNNLQLNFDTIENVNGYMTDWPVLKCVMYHLFSNAVKHSEKGTKILIKIGWLDEEEQHLLQVEIINQS